MWLTPVTTVSLLPPSSSIREMPVGPPRRHMSSCFSFVGLVLSGIEFEYEAVRTKYGR